MSHEPDGRVAYVIEADAELARACPELLLQDGEARVFAILPGMVVLIPGKLRVILFDADGEVLDVI